MKINIKPISQSSGGTTKLGNGTHTIKQSGCYLTCLFMAFKHFGKDFADLKAINKEFKEKGCFSGSLIVGGSVESAYDLTFDWVSSGDFEKIIKDRLDKKLPTIIRISKFEHFVLAIGYDDNGKIFVNDPLRGETYYLTATGYGIKSLRLYTPNNPMTNQTDLQACLDSHKDLLDQLVAKGKEMGRLEKRLQTSETVRKDLSKQYNEILPKLNSAEKESKALAIKLDTANTENEKLLEENEKLSGEKANYKKWYEKALVNDVSKKSRRQIIIYLIRSLIWRNA